MHAKKNYPLVNILWFSSPLENNANLGQRSVQSITAIESNGDPSCAENSQKKEMHDL